MIVRNTTLAVLTFVALNVQSAAQAAWHDLVQEQLDQAYLEENMRLGRKEGVFQETHPDGSLLSETPYQDYKIHGIKKEYYPSGKLKAEVHYKEGKVLGVAKEYYENGQVEGERNFNEHGLHGLDRRYYDNGQISEEIVYQDGVQVSPLKEYFKDGRSKPPIPQDGNGHYATYDEYGMKDETIFITGTDKQIYRSYYSGDRLQEETEQRKVIIKGIAHSKKNGLSKKFYEDGGLEWEMTYADDELLYGKHYSPEGKIIAEGPQVCDTCSAVPVYK